MASGRIFLHSNAKIFIIAFVMVCSAAGFSLPAGAAEKTVYGAVESFTWREFVGGQQLVKEHGPLYGIGFTYFNVSDGVTFKPRAEFFGGRVDYHGYACDAAGNCEPATTNVNYYGIKAEADVGRQFASARDFVEPFIGLGLRFWKRDIKNGTTASGLLTTGYVEDWLVIQGRAGVRGGIELTDKKRIFAEAGIKIPIYNENTAYLSNVGQGPDVTLHPGRQAAYFAEAGITVSRFQGTLFYDTLRFSPSSTASNGLVTVFQPESRMDVYGIRLGFVF